MLGEDVMNDVLLAGKHMTKSFVQGNKGTEVLSDISVNLYSGDFTMIMGPSGAGKSTLLYALSGMDSINEGSVEYQGRELCRLSDKEMAGLRAKEFGFVFQQCHLISYLTLYENVAVAGYLGKKEKALKDNFMPLDRNKKTLKDSFTPCGRNKAGAVIPERVEKLMREMGVWAVRNQLPAQASGGEQQRTAIARAVIHQPNLLFCDEPSGALNKANTEEVLALLSQLNRQGQSILMVTHDLQAAIYGNRILYLEDGKILDELVLPAYRKEEEKAREDKVNQWLVKLRW